MARTGLENRTEPEASGAIAAGRAEENGMGTGAVAALGRALAAAAAASWGRALGKVEEGRTKGATERAEGN